MSDQPMNDDDDKIELPALARIVVDLSGVPLIDNTDVSTMSFSVAPTITHGPTPHQALSKVVYDIARLVEKHAMTLPTDEDGEVVSAHQQEWEVWKSIMKMIAVAPLSQEYAARLAFEK